MRKIIPVLLLLLPLAASATDCRYSAPRNADLDAAGLKSLMLKLGSTDLNIQGVQGLDKVEVRGTACASKQSWLKDLQIDAHRHGDQAEVITQRDHSNSWNLFGSSYAYLKLQVRVPMSLATRVDSGSGDVQASQLAALDFTSGSGDLAADHIGGALALQVGSADVRARQVGSVELHDTGSGDINVDGVTGDVVAGRSGSGDLTFRNVQGRVKVGSAGSGDVTLERIGRGVEVGRTGSGDVNANGVGGDLLVRSTGSGDVHYADVKGKVDVPRDDD